MSLTVRVLVGLVAGLVAGLLVSALDQPSLTALAGGLEGVGTAWVSALRMTVIPLVVSLLLVGVASGDAGAVGRIGGRALGLFVALLLAAALFTVAAARPLMEMLEIEPAAAAALRASMATARTPSAEVPSLVDWLVELVPSNPFGAAVRGDMLPLILFTLVFAAALATLPAPRREPLVAFADGIAQGSLRVVHWVLALAPLGVFALALALARRLGLTAAGAIGYYVVVHSVLALIFLLALYPLAARFGRASLRAFAAATLPAQAVAFSSRSSLAALPALVEAAEEDLRLPPPIISFFIPFAVATFRVSAPITMTVGSLFIAQLYGIELATPQLIAIVLTSVVASFTVPGVPGGGVLVMVPVLMAANLPVEGIGLLLAVDTIPDSFRTTTNITADMAVASILARGPGRPPRLRGAHADALGEEGSAP